MGRVSHTKSRERGCSMHARYTLFVALSGAIMAFIRSRDASTNMHAEPTMYYSRNQMTSGKFYKADSVMSPNSNVPTLPHIVISPTLPPYSNFPPHCPYIVNYFSSMKIKSRRKKEKNPETLTGRDRSIKQ